MLDTGIDIVQISRIKQSINDSFLNLVLCDEEIKQYNQYKDNRAVEYVAGRWAAKEAVIKCLSDYEKVMMKDLCILNKENGKPFINYKNYDIKISISHEKDYAIAIAILNEIKKGDLL